MSTQCADLPSQGSISLGIALSSFRAFRAYLLASQNDAPLPSESAIATAWASLTNTGLRSLPVGAVVRSAEGGVTICFSNRRRYADVEFSNDGEVLGLTSNRRGDVRVYENDAISRVTEFLRSSIEAVLPSTRVR